MKQNTSTFNILLDTVRRFTRERLIPLEKQIDLDNKIPENIIDQMKVLGLFGLSIPKKYGGTGLTMEEEVKVAFELGYTSPAFRSVVGTNIGIGSQAIIIGGTEKQKNKYLPGLASGDIIGSFALTEPSAGSDAMSIQTKANKDGNNYILNGTKRYITNAPSANLFSVMAKTSDSKNSNSISCFLVESSYPGLTIGKIDKKMGQAGALTADVIMEDCIVPQSALLGEVEGKGFHTAMKVLDKGRLHISAVCVGLASRLIDECISYSLTRKQFDKPISEFQLIQAMIADSQTEMLAAKSMILYGAKKRDEGENTTLEASCAKLFSSESLGKIADRAVQIFGGAGYVSEYPIERFYRDARLFRIYEGTSQIQQLIIARELINNYKKEHIS